MARAFIILSTLILYTQASFSQAALPGKVFGSVKDTAGNALSYVNVAVQGTKYNTVSDEFGFLNSLFLLKNRLKLCFQPGLQYTFCSGYY
jgi:hypothetical protein